MLFAADMLTRRPGATVIYDVKSTRNLKPWIEQHGGKPLLWKTGHSLIKAKMKETGAELAGEMSGHTFFKERWYGFDDGMYAGARLLEILSRDADASAALHAIPDSLSTPELNIACADASPHALIDKLAATASFPGAVDVIRIDGLRVEYPDGFGLARASNTTPVIVLRFEADDARRARAHPGRVPPRAEPGDAGQAAAVLPMAIDYSTFARRHRLGGIDRLAGRRSFRQRPHAAADGNLVPQQLPLRHRPRRRDDRRHRTRAVRRRVQRLHRRRLDPVRVPPPRHRTARRRHALPGVCPASTSTCSPTIDAISMRPAVSFRARSACSASSASG